MSYVIIKKVRIGEDVKVLNVVLLDGHSQIKEYKTRDKAESAATMFRTNSDSGHEYSVKQVGIDDND